MAWLNLVWMLAAASTATAENLAPSAAWSATVSGFAYRGQVIPGTNTPATENGFRDAPLWQGHPDALTDGRRDGEAVQSWFWSAMDKRIRARFDLRRIARVSRIVVWPQAGQPFDAAFTRVAATEDLLPAAPELRCTRVDEDAMAWQGEAFEGRYVEVVCASGAPQMALAEVEIEGEPLTPFAEGAPGPGLLAVPARDLVALTRLPARPPGVVDVAARPETRLTARARYRDPQTAAWIDADPSPESVRALTDGDPGTAVRSHPQWYSAKELTVELDLGEAWRVERVIVWSAGHVEGARSYVNAFSLWGQVGPEAAWTPWGEARCPVLPGERPASEYPIVSAEIRRPARTLRLLLTGVAQSADVMEVGEIEVWASPLATPVAALPLRVVRAVPAVQREPRTGPAPVLAWIEAERLRGLYTYVGKWQDVDLLDHAVTAGFNTLIVHTMATSHSEAGWPQEAGEWARVQRERGLRVIFSWPFGSDERYANTQFGAYHAGDADTWTHTPCPVSEEYWQRVVGDRALIAARAGVTGLVVDMEMYGADSTRYAGPCYCDRCFARFVGDHLEGVQPDEVAAEERQAWIAGNGLAEDYARAQELAVQALLQRIEEAVHGVDPGFVLGNLLDPESLPGLARGFGTPALPALIFSELEYGGDVSRTRQRAQGLVEAGYPTLYVPGFSLGAVTPPQLPSLVAQAAAPTAGYWLWSAAAFDESVPEVYRHSADFTHDDYWQASAEANRLLRSPP